MKLVLTVVVGFTLFACKHQDVHKFERAKEENELNLGSIDQNFTIHIAHLNKVLIVRKEENRMNLARHRHNPKTVNQYVDRQIQTEVKGPEMARKQQADAHHTVGRRAVAKEGEIVYRGMKIDSHDAANIMAIGMVAPVMFKYSNNQVDGNTYVADTVQLHQQNSDNSIFISTSKNANATIDYTAGRGHSGVIFKIRVAKDQGIDVDTVATKHDTITPQREGDVLLLSVTPEDIVGFYDMDRAPVIDGRKRHLHPSAFVANDTQIFDMFSRLQKKPEETETIQGDVVVVVDNQRSDGTTRIIETFDANGNLIEAEL